MRGRRSGIATVGALLLLGGAATPWPVRAGTMTGAATEWTQIMNNVALIQHIIHAIQQVMALRQTVKYWAQTVKALGRSQDPMVILQGVQAALGTTRTVLFAGESIARNWNAKQRSGLTQEWADAHPGNKDPRSLGRADPDAFRRIDERVQMAVEKSLRTLDSQYSQLGSEDQVFRRLQQKVAGDGAGLSDDDKVKGQLQAAMVANELLLAILQEQKLTRQLLQAQALVMGEYVSADAQRRQFDDAIQRRDPGYSGRYRGGQAGSGGGGIGAGLQGFSTTLQGFSSAFGQGGSLFGGGSTSVVGTYGTSGAAEAPAPSSAQGGDDRTGPSSYTNGSGPAAPVGAGTYTTAGGQQFTDDRTGQKAYTNGSGPAAPVGAGTYTTASGQQFTDDRTGQKAYTNGSGPPATSSTRTGGYGTSDGNKFSDGLTDPDSYTTKSGKASTGSSATTGQKR